MLALPSRAALRRKAAALSPVNTVREAARVIVSLQALEIDAHAPAAICHGSEKALHDVRVASRRLKAGMSLFRELYPVRWPVIHDRAREVISGLRVERDLDVRMLRLRMMRADRTATKELRELARRLFTVVERERRMLLGRTWTVPFLGKRMREFIPELWNPRTARTPELERSLSGRLRELSREALLIIPPAAVERHAGIQHRLRIRCKALRYSLEMVEWRMGSEASWRIRILRNAQDVLGELHDVDVFLEFLAAQARRRPAPPRSPLREMREHMAQERRRHYASFMDLRPELERACASHNF
jgi:CHAD domain-containing protein